MKRVRMVALIVMGMAVTGCSSMDVASRNAPFEAPSAAATAPAMKVESYQVRVPQSLRVSEANLYYPSADIVWRGEPLGDRHTQVQKIFEESLAAGAQGSHGNVPVLLDIEVKRFHALTEKARYTVGGRHEIEFVVNFLNPETRQPVAEPRKIDATFKAFGGARAVHAEQNGITQKDRIVNHLAGVFQHELGIAARKTDAPVQPIPVVSQNASPLSMGDPTNSLF
ncbi:DUF6778 family protein [Marimonas lutisalis]|uniref:DUF6778 family protein n=1 Tax=Marimonas lutisalis TaxID=2545756 RepID=UPI0018748D71|nr:DUF6778 family protein [Marimonas lutisalis]